MQTQHFASGVEIFREGDRAFTAYLLLTGRVEISREREGRKVVLAEVGPMQVFGELALVDHTTRNATAKAIGAVEVHVITATVLEAKMQALDPFMRGWVKYLIGCVKRMDDRITDLPG